MDFSLLEDEWVTLSKLDELWETFPSYSHLARGKLIPRVAMTGLRQYRHTSLYCALFYCPSEIFHFLYIEVLWQPCIEQVYRCHFSNSICSLYVFASHFGNTHNISNFFIITPLWWSVVIDLWCYYCKKILTCLRFRCWLAFISNKVFFIKVCTLFFRHNAVSFT